jgi:hypothetical protein
VNSGAFVHPTPLVEEVMQELARFAAEPPQDQADGGYQRKYAEMIVARVRTYDLDRLG